ncbi:MAG TPA: ATP-binding protein [Clostridia bacterium]|nr:ATP-binding protein [Clostridia bacterium]
MPQTLSHTLDVDFRTLFETTASAAVVLRPDCTAVAVSNTFLQLTSRRREDLVGRHINEVFPDNPNDPQASGVRAFRESLERVVRSRKPDVIPAQRHDIQVPPSGQFEARYWKMINSPVPGPDSSVAFVISQIEDLTPSAAGLPCGLENRECVEAALQASEQRFAAFMQRLPGAAWLKDLKGRYLYINPEEERRIGRSLEEAYGKRDEELFDPKTAADFRANDQRALQEGGEVRTMEVLRETDGVEHHYMVSKFVVPGPSGEAAYVGGLAYDITESRVAEQALQRAWNDLRRLNETLETEVRERTANVREIVAELQQMSYSMVHEMRAPLRAIASFAQLLLREYGDQLEEGARDYVDRIQTAAKRMDRLVTDALNYNKVLQQRLPLHRVDVGRLLCDMVCTHQAFHAPQADVQLRGRFPDVIGNEAMLSQCFSHLLDNAVKFVKPGVHPKVNVWAQCPALEPGARPRVRIWIEDNGIGIEPDAQEQVFELFYRISPDFEGTGIGLAIVRKLVQQMDGQVGVQSQLGQGSRFWIDLPAAVESISDQDQGGAKPEAHLANRPA